MVWTQLLNKMLCVTSRAHCRETHDKFLVLVKTSVFFFFFFLRDFLREILPDLLNHKPPLSSTLSCQFHVVCVRFSATNCEAFSCRKMDMGPLRCMCSTVLGLG